MVLYFPQWQGAGTGRALADGAAGIREACNDLMFDEISSFTHEPCPTEYGIQHHRSLVASQGFDFGPPEATD